jgi:outer membrane protein assembly factor BamE (lipoprotein component of BamABCDE complex)
MGMGEMHYSFITALAVLSLMMAGCASVGNESIADSTQQSVAAQLVKGQTTQDQVRKLYGDPIKTAFTDSGNESWEYEFTRLEPKATNFIPYVNLVHSGAEGDKKSIVILFNKNKVVQQYTVSNSKVDISQGLLAR